MTSCGFTRGVLRQGQTELTRLEMYLPMSRFAPFFLHSYCNYLIRLSACLKSVAIAVEGRLRESARRPTAVPSNRSQRERRSPRVKAPSVSDLKRPAGHLDLLVTAVVMCSERRIWNTSVLHRVTKRPSNVTRKSRGQLIYYCVADCAKFCRHLTTVSVVSRLSECHFGTHIAVTSEGYSLERARPDRLFAISLIGYSTLPGH
jgi:hypothetical protein